MKIKKLDVLGFLILVVSLLGKLGREAHLCVRARNSAPSVQSSFNIWRKYNRQQGKGDDKIGDNNKIDGKPWHIRYMRRKYKMKEVVREPSSKRRKLTE